jgi:hypothetical protein
MTTQREDRSAHQLHLILLDWSRIYSVLTLTTLTECVRKTVAVPGQTLPDIAKICMISMVMI